MVELKKVAFVDCLEYLPTATTRIVTLSPLLSIIVPVQDAENILTTKVNELLEVAAELTSDFELLIIDDGSTDDTEEMAMELSREFPQVRTIRYSEQRGEMSAARVGIANTTGEVVLIHDINSPLSGDAVRQFWAMRDDKELVFARSEAAHQVRLPHLQSVRGGIWSGTQMLRREAVNELQDNQGRAKIDRVMRTDLGDVANNPSSMLRQLTDAPAPAPQMDS